MLKLSTNKKLCPHLKEPFDSCYCVKMSSQDIERAVYLCSMHFEICDRYKSTSASDNGNRNRMSGSARAQHRPAKC